MPAANAPFPVPAMSCAPLTRPLSPPPCHRSASSCLETDIAYTRKPVWDSYLEFINISMADGAFMAEKPGGSDAT